LWRMVTVAVVWGPRVANPCGLLSVKLIVAVPEVSLRAGVGMSKDAEVWPLGKRGVPEGRGEAGPGTPGPAPVGDVTATVPSVPPERVTVTVALPAFSFTMYVAALNCKLPWWKTGNADVWNATTVLKVSTGT